MKLDAAPCPPPRRGRGPGSGVGSTGAAAACAPTGTAVTRVASRCMVAARLSRGVTHDHEKTHTAHRQSDYGIGKNSEREPKARARGEAPRAPRGRERANGVTHRMYTGPLSRRRAPHTPPAAPPLPPMRSLTVHPPRWALAGLTNNCLKALFPPAAARCEHRQPHLGIIILVRVIIFVGICAAAGGDACPSLHQLGS